MLGEALMSVSRSWWEAAYVAMIPVLRRRFDDQDLVHDAAVERLIEISKRREPTPASEDEFVRLCLYGAGWRARDLLRKRGGLGLKRRWAPPEKVIDPWFEPKVREARALLQAQWACLRKLPDRSRELLELYYFDGRSDRDVARLLAGMSDEEIQLEDVRIRKSLEPRRGEVAAERAEAKARKREIEAGRKAVSRERLRALWRLRELIEAEEAAQSAPLVA